MVCNFNCNCLPVSTCVCLKVFYQCNDDTKSCGYKNCIPGNFCENGNLNYFAKYIFANDLLEQNKRCGMATLSQNLIS